MALRTPVHLDHIVQAGCSGVVSALHDVPVGAVWPKEEIRVHKNKIDQAGLSWWIIRIKVVLPHFWWNSSTGIHQDTIFQ